MTEQTVPTWGYHARQPARVFELKPGEVLPKGWRDRPLAADEPAAEPVAPTPTARKGKRHA